MKTQNDVDKVVFYAGFVIWGVIERASEK